MEREKSVLPIVVLVPGTSSVHIPGSLTTESGQETGQAFCHLQDMVSVTACVRLEQVHISL